MSRTKIIAGLSALCMLAFGAACSSDPEVVEKIVEVEKEVVKDLKINKINNFDKKYSNQNCT